MSKKMPNNESPVQAFTSDSARQRWELFHRAIAHAKESNNALLLDDDDPRSSDSESSGPLLTIVR